MPEAWVQQSVNQAGGDVLGRPSSGPSSPARSAQPQHHVFKGQLFLTESAFLADLRRWAAPSLRSHAV